MTPLVAKIMTFVAMAGVIALLAMSAGHTALGAEAAHATDGVRPVSPADFSARKKRHRSNASSVMVAPPPSYRRANPNYGPGTAQMLQAREQHRCVIDEGYGRWTACSNE